MPEDDTRLPTCQGDATPTEYLAQWTLSRNTWKSRLDATQDEGERLLLLCGVSVAERMVWQLRRDAEAAACQSRS